MGGLLCAAAGRAGCLREAAAAAERAGGGGGAPTGASSGGRWHRWQAGRSTLRTCLNCFKGPLSPNAGAVAKVLAAGESALSSDPARQASVRQLAVCCRAISVVHAEAGWGRGAPRPQPAPPGASSALSSRRAPRPAARRMAVCMTCKAELGVPRRRPRPLGPLAKFADWPTVLVSSGAEGACFGNRHGVRSIHGRPVGPQARSRQPRSLYCS
jgi:hypothetical protein